MHNIIHLDLVYGITGGRLEMCLTYGTQIESERSDKQQIRNAYDDSLHDDRVAFNVIRCKR